VKLTTHVLDAARGLPAESIPIVLYAIEGDGRRLIAHTVTNSDGRTEAPLAGELEPGTYELVFSVAGYFERLRTPALYDDISIRVRLTNEASYHVPLLLAPWSYATYRGS
jgi:5-hydroxyisourate hydrolase